MTSTGKLALRSFTEMCMFLFNCYFKKLFICECLERKNCKTAGKAEDTKSNYFIIEYI